MLPTMWIVDAHLDLSYNAVVRGRDVRRPAAEQPPVKNEIATVGFPDLRAGGVSLICGTIFCSPRSYREDGYETAEQAHAMALSQWAWYERMMAEGELRQVKSAGELPAAPAPCHSERQRGISASSDAPLTDRSLASLGMTAGADRRAIPFILLIEGADVFRSPEDVGEWYARGLRMVGLAWRKNRMAGGTGHPGPISSEGLAIVRAMNELGIIHDISHLAEQAFWDLMEHGAGPVCASHSNCRAIVPGDRQISDEMIRAIVSRGGVIGINFYDEFLIPPGEYKKRKCAMSDVIAHAKHLCDVIGDAQHVALGTDMDGGVGRDDIPRELTTSADLPRIAEHLSAAGFGDADVRAIMGENWMRFFRGALPG